MAGAGWALQTAIYAKLAADAALGAVLGGPRVYDDVPQRAEFPYLTFGQSSEKDWSTQTDDGIEHVVALQVWSRAAGRRECDDILQAARTSLHNAALTLPGHRLINFRHELSEVRREADGVTFRGTARFRAVTEPL